MPTPRTGTVQLYQHLEQNSSDIPTPRAEQFRYTKTSSRTVVKYYLRSSVRLNGPLDRIYQDHSRTSGRRQIVLVCTYACASTDTRRFCCTYLYIKQTKTLIPPATRKSNSTVSASIMASLDSK